MVETLQEKILPPDVADISNDLTDDVARNAAIGANVLADESLNATKTLTTKILDGAQNFINSEHFIIWIVILISSFLYTLAVYGVNKKELLSDLLSGEMLFSLFVLSVIYGWPEYMPNVLKFSSKKITFVPYNINSFRERFTHKRNSRKNVEIY